MPKHSQTIVQPPTKPKRNLGSRDDESMRSCFPASPLWDRTDDDVKEEFVEKVLGGDVNDGGHTFGKMSRDYVDAPDMDEVDVDKHNLPSPYVPNPTSPGPGSVSPTDQPAPPEGFGTSPSDTPFEGVGALESPKATSEKQARHTLGQYELGKAIGN
jgi:hypothetical protein